MFIPHCTGDYTSCLLACLQTKQTSWEDRRRASTSDSLNETEFDKKWQHIGSVSEQEATPLLEQDKRRPWRSSRSSLRKRSTKVRHRVHQLFRSQNSPTTNSCDEVSRAPSEDADKARTKKEKAAETAGGRGSSNGRSYYREATRVEWCLPVPFAMMPMGIPARLW
ncbi:hypothetical protein LX32DRAFT_363810 [Colletotrichum zoysiae]|uniref:Uncharacterized protein n=1 Tax=Colletotrichum zoysiae TaxID=1216348 RepID=A0AAD9HI71_9PEZI|nr:hypothetical protein LX32DRAFT_363810 [Colletotrichum zoysiae]